MPPLFSQRDRATSLSPLSRFPPLVFRVAALVRRHRRRIGTRLSRFPRQAFQVAAVPVALDRRRRRRIWPRLKRCFRGIRKCSWSCRQGARLPQYPPGSSSDHNYPLLHLPSNPRISCPWGKGYHGLSGRQAAALQKGSLLFEPVIIPAVRPSRPWRG